MKEFSLRNHVKSWMWIWRDGSALAALEDDPDSVSRTHISAPQLSVAPVPGIQCLLLVSEEFFFFFETGLFVLRQGFSV
jgi:hypothetical protein